MARKKLYYTTGDIESGLYTSGNQFEQADGTMYIGQYHRYISTNEYYTGATWNAKTSRKIIPILQTESAEVKLYKQLRPNIKTKYINPSSVPVTITNQDLKQGYVKRFIFSKINDKQVIESDQLQYEAWQRGDIDNNIYIAFSINWYITGELYSKRENGVLIEGVIEKNQRILDILNTNPEVANYLENPLQFYADTSIVIPTDINGLDS